MNIESAITVSAKIALVSTAITLIIGVLAAYFETKRKKRSIVWSLVDNILMLPLFFPPSLVGYFLLLLFGNTNPVGKALSALGVQMLFTWQAGVIAAVIISLPIVYLNCRAIFLSVEKVYLETAQMLGASFFRILWHVVLPMTYKSVAAAILLGFGRAFGEFGATLMVCGNIPGVTQTIPTALYFAVQAGDTSASMIFATVVLAVSVASVAVYRRLAWAH